MNIKLIKLLAVICSVLCIIILCEWAYAVFAQKNLLASIEAVDKHKKVAAELPTIELAKKPETSYVDLVMRPLFIQGRKPVNEPTAAQVPVSNPGSDVFNWALNGIYTSQNSLFALFTRTNAKVPKDNYRKVTKNNDIDGWKLIKINKEKVVLSQGGKEKEVPLRKTKPKDATGSQIGNPSLAPTIPQPIPNQMEQQPMNQVGQPTMIEPPGQQPIPVPEPIMEPELIPDENSESNFENSDDEQFQ